MGDCRPGFLVFGFWTFVLRFIGLSVIISHSSLIGSFTLAQANQKTGFQSGVDPPGSLALAADQ